MNEKSLHRIDISIAEDRNFSKTLCMFDCSDIFELHRADIDRIDIMVQNATGGFDSVFCADVDALQQHAGSSDNGHGEVFKIVIRGHRAQSLE